MHPSKYPVVIEFTNSSGKDMRIVLEMTCEEVILSPGHHVELMAIADPDPLPLTIEPVADGFQVHPCRVFDPDWHIRFNGKVIRPGYLTVLSEYL